MYNIQLNENHYRAKKIKTITIISFKAKPTSVLRTGCSCLQQQQQWQKINGKKWFVVLCRFLFSFSRYKWLIYFFLIIQGFHSTKKPIKTKIIYFDVENLNIKSKKKFQIISRIKILIELRIKTKINRHTCCHL